MKDLRVLGIITARGCSKGLPRKNVLPLAGKPLIAHTIETALEARRLDRVVVSTDDEEIADVARRYGAEVPFMRPAELARDDTLHIPVLRHTILWLQEHEGYNADYFICLQPTSPLRTTADIDHSIELAAEKDADAVIGFAPARQHPYWMKTLTDDGRLAEFLPDREPRYLRRQNLPSLYYPVGSIFVAKPSLMIKQESFFTDKTYAYLVPVERTLDIDSLLEFRLAEFLLQEREILDSDSRKAN